MTPGPRFMGDEAEGQSPASKAGPSAKVVMGKDGKPVPQPEKTWLQKNWVLLAIGAAVVRSAFSPHQPHRPAAI